MFLVMPNTTKNKTILTKVLSSDLLLNRDARTLGFSFSSKSNICERYSLYGDLPEGASVVFDEQLSHDARSWDLTRVTNKTCPFLKNHARGQKIGIVTEVALDGDRGMATVKLSRNALAEQFMSDIEDGTSGGISFGYTVEEYRVITPAEYATDKDGCVMLTKKALLEATKIVLLEISSEDIPADPTVGYGKSLVCFDDISVKGDPNFNPNRKMNEKTELELTTTKLELTGIKTALAEANNTNVLLSEKQVLLTNENNRLSEQIKVLSKSIEEKNTAISTFEKRESVVSRYYDLRQKAEDLVSEGKLAAVEFGELFSEKPSNDIAHHTKSDRLGYIEFHLELINKRTAPLLNLKQSISEPIVNAGQSNPADLETRALQIIQSLGQSKPIID